MFLASVINISGLVAKLLYFNIYIYMYAKNTFATGIVTGLDGYKPYGTGVTTAKKPWAKKCKVRDGTNTQK
jgi:hypothetical protein